MSEILVTTVKHESATTDNITLASNGNVGIATSSPVAKLAVVGGTSNASNLSTAYSLAAFNITPKSTSGYSFQFGSGPADLPYIQMSAGGAASGDMTIQPYGGNLLVGKTSNSSAVSTQGINLRETGQIIANTAASGSAPLYVCRDDNGDGIVFFRDGAVRGEVVINTSSVSYNTTSDYRLKENVVGLGNASSRVLQLNPVRFNFIGASDTVDGFLAHEAQAVVPEAVSGEKDAVDADGNPDYQGIDQSKLVPLLTAALQEALSKIDDLTERVSALETA